MISKLQEGQRPIVDYVTVFHVWSADTQWEDSALCYQFCLGLSDVLKDEREIIWHTEIV